MTSWGVGLCSEIVVATSGVQVGGGGVRDQLGVALDQEPDRYSSTCRHDHKI